MTKAELHAALNSIESNAADRPDDELRKTVYELQIYQIELEMQNRQLRETQEDLHGAVGRYSDLYDFAPVGYLTLDDTGRIKEVNLTAAAMLGIERLNVTGQYFARFLAESDVHTFRQHLHTCKTAHGKVVAEVSLVLDDGRSMDVELTSIAVLQNEYRTSMTDITERKQAQKHAVHEREFSELLVNSSVEGIFAVDRQCRLTRWNEAMERLFTIPKSQAIGACLYDVLAFLKQNGEDQFINEVLSGRVNASHLRPFSQNQPSGQRFFEAQYSPLLADKGDVSGVIAIIRDVTERVEATEKIEVLNFELQRKNRELETIISFASHDIRAPLINVQGFSDALSKDCVAMAALLEKAPLTEEQNKEAVALFENFQTCTGFIQNSAKEVDILFTNLLTVTKAGLTPLALKKVNTNELFADLMKNLEYKIKECGVAVTIEPLPPCTADEAQIKQVFSNLVDNAVKYLDPARPGQIKISGVTQGDSAVYCIEDNGVGIPEKNIRKVFEFSLRLDGNAAKGEGIGLTIVHRIVEKHLGRVWVESHVGKGSKFFVALPM
jgi:PAS domain S-box-containing protein